MNEEILFRMNFILQDSAAAKTSAYLGKMIESIIYDEKRGLSVDELRELIYKKYILEFSNDEIEEAAEKLLRRANHLLLKDSKYILAPTCEKKFDSQDTIECLLKKYCKQAIEELNLSIENEYLYSLITRYVYHCFNTNEVVLMSLIDGKYEKSIESFKASNEEILYINAFLNWDNNDKNVLLYKIISYCYVYCTLNTKKDILLSKAIFKSKHFFLDANIIFRLAGINNDDRQTTVKSFINKCKEVGILLSITSETVDEVYRVIRSKVASIQGITHSAEPISIDLNSYGNDFYNLYIDWCKKPGNKYDDFHAFAKYLENLVNEVMASLDFVDISEVKYKNNQEYNNYVETLKEYKNQYQVRQQSVASIETDVMNVMFVKQQRKNGTANSIFSINTYFISADHNLINWYQKKSSGVPLIVLPSIWLTIILRYTGRSNDDYQSFVSFMGLRTHEATDDLDVFSVLKELGYHTSDKDLKEKIVSEVIANKNKYIQDAKNNTVVVKKAFDVVKEQEQDELRESFIRDQSVREQKIKNDNEIQMNLLKNREQESSVNKLALNKLNRYKKNYKVAIALSYTLCLAILILALIVIVCWVYKQEPIYSFVQDRMPKTLSFEGNIAVIGVLGTIAELIVSLIVKALKYMVSDNKLQSQLKKYERKYLDILRNN